MCMFVCVYDTPAGDVCVYACGTVFCMTGKTRMHPMVCSWCMCVCVLWCVCVCVCYGVCVCVIVL